MVFCYFNRPHTVAPCMASPSGRLRLAVRRLFPSDSDTFSADAHGEEAAMRFVRRSIATTAGASTRSVSPPAPTLPGLRNTAQTVRPYFTAWQASSLRRSSTGRLAAVRAVCFAFRQGRIA